MKIPVSIAKSFEKIAVSKHNYALAYLNISNHLTFINYPGIASYFLKKHEEKISASYQIVDYLAVRGHTYNFQKLEAPHVSKSNLLSFFQFHYNSEEALFKELNETAIQAKAEGDIKSYNYLQELVSAGHIALADSDENLAKAHSYETVKGFYYHLDEELG